MKESARGVSAVALCSSVDCTGQLSCYILDDLLGEASGLQDFFEEER